MKTLPKYANKRAWTVAAILWLALCPMAHAHIEAGQASGFASGFKHPWGGLDHVAAMIAVGLWGAQLGLPAIWLLPVAFPLVMAVGGFLGLMGVPLPGVEVAVAASALLLGLIVAAEVKPKNLIWPALLVGLFGLFHGHVHGTELPPGQNGLLYSIGFVSATGTLHGCGIALGTIHRWAAGQKALRVFGAVIALGGAYFLWEALRPEATVSTTVPAKMESTKLRK
jgi:urease accessory protein